MSGSRPAVAVCISTRNRAHMLPALFEALAAQAGGVAFEVSVTDDGSTDDTYATLQRIDAAASFPVTIHRNETSQGPSVGRNLAAAHTSAPVLAFTDDDCRPEPEWLHAGLQAIGTDHAAVVGFVAPPVGASVSHPLGRVVRSSHWRFFIGSNVFYRADDFAAVGGFDEGFRFGGEDADLGWRICKAGADPRYEPSAVVRHPVREPNLRVALREAWRWHGIPRFIKRHPEQRELLLTNRVFWKPSHKWMTLALLAVAFSWLTPFTLIGVVPWIWTRIWPARTRRDRVRNAVFAPATAMIDLLEIGAMLRGSVRERTLTV